MVKSSRNIRDESGGIVGHTSMKHQATNQSIVRAELDQNLEHIGDSDELRKHLFADRLVLWFRANQRDLPWRRTKDPYHIWVSEIMLQQTRVDTVIPYYERFISRYPTVEALAEATEADLLKVWEGLGYYSRVRNMQLAAKTVQQEYGGKIPATREEISKLKGIGPYTAGAVLSIAYGAPEPAVDGNVLRVISRYFSLYDDIAKPSTRSKVEQLVGEIIPDDAAADFNQALMELGALICTPRSPSCGTCPVGGSCSAHLAGIAEELPIKTKAKKPRIEERAAYIIEGTGERQGMVMLRKRPDEGLLARMWELPNEQLASDMQEQLGLSDHYYMDAEHIFSHIRWQMKVYRCEEHEVDELLGKPIVERVDLHTRPSDVAAEKSAQLTGRSDGSRVQGAPVGIPADDAIAETASPYGPPYGHDADEGATETAAAAERGSTDTTDGTMWVSRDTWRNVALPNVFIRILSQYFDDGLPDKE